MATTKIGIWNDQNATRSRVIYVEPWGEDYTLLPDEKLEIVADSGADDIPWFDIVESNDATQVYCESKTAGKAGPTSLTRSVLRK